MKAIAINHSTGIRRTTLTSYVSVIRGNAKIQIRQKSLVHVIATC